LKKKQKTLLKNKKIPLRHMKLKVNKTCVVFFKKTSVKLNTKMTCRLLYVFRHGID